MRLTELSRKRLRKLADYIERHPDFYDQDQWGSALLPTYRPTNGQLFELARKVKERDEPMCGTAACLAGHAAALAGYTVTGSRAIKVPHRKPDGRTAGEAAEVEDVRAAACQWLFDDRQADDHFDFDLFVGSPTGYEDWDENVWPDSYANEYGEAGTNRGRARAAARLLRDIADGKVNLF